MFCSSARMWSSVPISTAPQCSLLPTLKEFLGILHNLCRLDPKDNHFSRNTGTILPWYHHPLRRSTNPTYAQGHMSPIVWILLVSHGNMSLAYKFYIQIKISRLPGYCPQKPLTPEVLAAPLMPPESLSHSMLLFGCLRTSDARSCSPWTLPSHHYISGYLLAVLDPEPVTSTPSCPFCSGNGNSMLQPQQGSRGSVGQDGEKLEIFCATSEGGLLPSCETLGWTSSHPHTAWLPESWLGLTEWRAMGVYRPCG